MNKSIEKTIKHKGEDKNFHKNKQKEKAIEVKKEPYILLPDNKTKHKSFTLQAIRKAKCIDFTYAEEFNVAPSMNCSDRFQARHNISQEKEKNTHVDFTGFRVKNCVSIKREYFEFYVVAKKWKATIKRNEVYGKNKYHTQFLFKLLRLYYNQNMTDVLAVTAKLILEEKLHVFRAFILAHYAVHDYRSAGPVYGNNCGFKWYIPNYNQGRSILADFARFKPYVMSVNDHMQSLLDSHQINNSFLYEAHSRFKIFFNTDDSVSTKYFDAELTDSKIYDKVEALFKLTKEGKWKEANKLLKTKRYIPLC